MIANVIAQYSYSPINFPHFHGTISATLTLLQTMRTFNSLFKRRGAEGFDTLLTPHLAYLYRLAYRFCGNSHDAEDLLQNLLIKLYPRYQELLAIENLNSWLARSLYHLFIDATRKDKRNPLHGALEEEELKDHLSPQQEPDESLENTQLQQQLHKALESLNPDQRALIGLHDMEGYTLQEIELLIDTPLGTLKSRLHRARKQLREQLMMEPFLDIERFNQQRAIK